MALILPVLAVLTMGIIELGYLLHNYILIVNLGREGARVAVDGAINQEIRSVLSLEGTRRLPTYATDAAVLIVRGRTADSNGSGGVWNVDPCNPGGFTLRAQQSQITGFELNGTTGYQFVLVEVHFLHRTITQLPFANDVPVTSRAVIRTAATNVNGSC